MLTNVHPKLPMRNQAVTNAFYIDLLGFKPLGSLIYTAYSMFTRDQIQIHFFLHPDLDPLTNDGQMYIRTDNIEALYQEALQHKWPIHPSGKLGMRPWGVQEFSILDPDHNLITFGSES